MKRPALWLGLLLLVTALAFLVRRPLAAPSAVASDRAGAEAEAGEDPRPGATSPAPAPKAAAPEAAKGVESSPGSVPAAKTQPRLLKLLQDFKAGTLSAPPPASLVVDKSVPNVDLVVFLHPGQEAPAVEGVVFRSRAGHVATATAAITAVERLAEHAAVRLVALPDRHTPKNDTATAGSIACFGSISSGGQLDDYGYAAQAGETATIRVHRSSPASLDPEIEVYDASMTLVGANDDGTPGLDSRLTLTFASTATYTLRVRAHLDLTTGPYDLIVESSRPASLGVLSGGDLSPGNQARHVGSSVLAATAGGISGEGVLLGIVDSGIDWSHGDFITPAGESRILFLWDQRKTGGPAPDVGGDGNPGNDYGVEYPRAEINGWIAALPAKPASPWPGFDDESHGTAVAGAAAGDGSATDGDEPAGRYRGVSTGSDLLFVKLGPTFDIVDGLIYMANKAAELGRPVVINVSSGSNIGPHDGTGVTAQVVDALSGPGVIFVVAAGNEGINPIHARAVIAAGASVDIPYDIEEPFDADVNIWADAGDQFTVVLTPPSGSPITATSGTSAGGTRNGYVVDVFNRVGGPSALNGATEIYIAFTSTTSPGSPVAGWTIALTRTASGGGGIVDAYASVGGVGGTFGAAFVPAGPEPGSVEGTLTDLATSAEAITVGAYSTKYRWDADLGGTFFQSGAFQDFSGLASFSSRGPTRLGGAKPDLVAPGDVVTTAFSDESLGGATDPDSVGLDGFHTHISGTSFAAPHVAGIIALMLEKNRYLTPSEVRAALQASAYTDVTTVDPESVGAGKANADGALAAVAPPAPNTAPGAASLEQLTPGLASIALGGSAGSAGTVTLRAALTDPESQNVKLQVEVKPVATAFDGAGLVESLFVPGGTVASVTVGGLAVDSYHWRARAVDTGGGNGDPPLNSAWTSFGGNLETEADFLVVAAPRRSGGGGGGCGLTGLEPLLLLLLRRRRR